jgi:transmembrane sensor
MHSRPDDMKHIFHRLLKGEATPGEKEQLAAYFSDKGHEADWNELLPYEDWENTISQPLSAHLRSKVLEHVLQPQNNKRSILMRRWLSYAAAVFLVCVAIAGYFMVDRSKKVNWMVIVAANGESKKILLSDSSIVYLNAGSQVRFPERFEGHNREIFLSGEAFFEARHNANDPLIVRSGAVSTTVLGTSFNIAAYKEDPAISVAVRSGRVQVSSRGAGSVVLIPGQQLTYTGMANHVRSIDTAAIAGWKNNYLVFTNSSLQEIITILEKKYNVPIAASPADALQGRYSVVFDHLDLQGSLHKLSLLGNLQVSRQDSLILLKVRRINGKTVNSK